MFNKLLFFLDKFLSIGKPQKESPEKSGFGLEVVEYAPGKVLFV
jgi:hypothetical protein